MEKAKAEIERLTEEISVRRQEIENIKLKCTVANMKYKPGTAVVVASFRGNVVPGFVERAWLTPEFKVFYSILKMKKDGSPSKMYLDCSGDRGGAISEDKITLREEK